MEVTLGVERWEVGNDPNHFEKCLVPVKLNLNRRYWRAVPRQVPPGRIACKELRHSGDPLRVVDHSKRVADVVAEYYDSIGRPDRPQIHLLPLDPVARTEPKGHERD